MQEEAIGKPGTARGAQPAAELARALSEALSAVDHARVRSLVEGLEAPDLADLIEQLEPAQRVPLIEALGSGFRPEVLSELDAAVRAQQPMPVIGFLNSFSAEGFTEFARGFREGLKEIGYVEGENVAIEYRWGEGQIDRLPALAAELVGRRP